MKRAAWLVLLVLISINNFAAIVSDSDGSVFVTKDEFENLKSNFNVQIDRYNSSIDTKIDGKISDYIKGIYISGKGTLSSKDTGIFWSIGPFDRPRFKLGIPLYDFMTTRARYGANWTGTGGSSGNRNNADYWVAQASWGDDFTNKTPLVNSLWMYNDIICDGTNPTASQAKLTGIYPNSGHFITMWRLYSIQNQWTDFPNLPASNDFWANGAAGSMSAQSKTTEASIYWNFDLRVGAMGATGTAGHMTYSASDLSTNNNTNLASVVKGSKITWDDRITCFGPISYNCFTPDINNYDYGHIVYNNGKYDEVLYKNVDVTAANAGNPLTPGDKNLLYLHVPDRRAIANNPWNKTTLSNWQSTLFLGVYLYNSDYAQLMNEWGTIPFYIDEGWCPSNVSSWGGWAPDRVYMPDVKFLNIDNWNKVGRGLDNTVLTYINSVAGNNATFKSSDGENLISLAAGLPICNIDGYRRVRVEGTFRKDCAYSYNSTTDENVLNEGTIDNTTPYVVYAKLTPFDITKLPEDESDLIDISLLDGETVKDTDCKGKLTKCRIIRDGKLKFDIINEAADEKVVFIKWEKLSNWNAARTSRRTGDAVNVNNRIDGSNTNTRTNPTWTYFGGGYLKLNKEFLWEEIVY